MPTNAPAAATTQAPGRRALHPRDRPPLPRPPRLRGDRPRGAGRGRGPARRPEPRLLDPRHLLHRRGKRLGRGAGPAGPHHPAVPLAEPRLRRFRRLPRRSFLAQAQGDPQGARAGERLRRRDRRADRRRDRARALGRLLALLPGHRRPQVGLALPDPRLLRPGAGNPARRHAAVPRPPGPALDRGRTQLHRPRHALRPLLGLHRGPPLPAFRALLLPRHRARHRSRHGRVEAGAQGAHKLARGYLPVETHSLHWIADPGLERAIAQYLDAERRAVDQEIEVLTAYGPFRRDRAAETCETD
jgi:hypothetical protein